MPALGRSSASRQTSPRRPRLDDRDCRDPTKARGARRFTETEIAPILKQQMQVATPIFTRDDGKRLWMFRDRFYWEDQGLDTEDVTALAREREMKRQRQLDRAHSVARADDVPVAKRESIPREVRLAVWE